MRAEDLKDYELTDSGKVLLTWLSQTHADVFELGSEDWAKYLFMEALSDTVFKPATTALLAQFEAFEGSFQDLIDCGLVRLKVVNIPVLLRLSKAMTIVDLATSMGTSVEKAQAAVDAAVYVPPEVPKFDPLIDWEPRCLDCGGTLELVEFGKYEWRQPLLKDGTLDDSDTPETIDVDDQYWRCQVDEKHRVPYMYQDVDSDCWIADREIVPVDDGVGL